MNLRSVTGRWQRSVIFGLAATTFGTGIADFAFGASYDLASQFSLAANPNGAWSYGWKPTVDGTFTKILYKQSVSAAPGVTVESWLLAASLDPAVNRHGGTTAWNLGYATIPPGTVWFHAGSNGRPENFGVIRFTVPTGEGGTYSLQSAVQPLYPGSPQGDTDFHVVKNGTELFGKFLAPAETAGYTNDLPLLEGDTIDFVIGRGQDGNLFASELKITATLRLGTNVPPVEPTVVRGPYLQGQTTTNIVVRWRTDFPTDSRVHFGTNGNSLTSQASDATVTTEHTVTLEGLASDTKYFYAIGTGADILEGGPEYHFTTPPSGPKATRIWAIGDCGTAGFGSSAPLAVRNAYAGFAAGRPTDVWLMLGDNAYFSGTDSEYQAAVFNVYQDFLRTTPVWSTLGNHETYAPGPGGQLAYFDIFNLPQDGRSGGVASGTERYYSFDYGDIHFVCLDSETSDKSPTGPMLTWLEQDLAANTKQWTIAFWHSPPYTKGSHDSDFEGNLVQMRQSVVPVLENYGVDLVLGGHSHSYERSFLLNGHYGTSGSLIPSMIRDDGSGRPEETGAYSKNTNGDGQGAVYVVAGSSGQTSGGQLNHPAMFASLNQLGSLVIDVETNRMQVKFLRETGEVDDHFTIIKGGDEPVAPSIVAGPTSQTVVIGGTASFSVDAEGTAPFTYYWRFNGEFIDGETNATLVLTDVQLSEAGNYSVRVANAAGFIFSEDAALTVTPVTVASTYDLSRDFSLASNPNGVWSYGWAPTVGGIFSPITLKQTVAVAGNIPIQSWQLGPSKNPAVFHNGGTNTWNPTQGTFPPGATWFHGGDNGQPENFGVIRFTVPAGQSGNYDLHAGVQPHFLPPYAGDTDFHVVKNGAELFGKFLATNEGANYSNILALNAGDTIDFVIGRGADGNQFASGLKIQATLTLTTNSPPQPPATDFDLSHAFSLASNPNGAWSYGWSPTIGGAFSPVTFKQTVNVAGNIPIQSWQLGPSSTPAVFHNGGTNTWSPTEGTFPPGATWFHGGDNGRPENFGVIRFTVPSGQAGNYELRTAVEPHFFPAFAGDTDFHVVKNGTELFGRFLAKDQGTSYSNILTLGNGDTIDFVIGRGADSNQFASGLKIQAALTLTTNVPPLPACAPAPNGLVAWWPFDGNANDIVGGATLALTGGPSYTDGKVAQALQFDGANDQALHPATPALNVGLGAGFSIEAWVNPTHVTMQPLVEWNASTPGVGGAHFWIGVYGSGSLFANLVDTSNISHSWRSETDIVQSNVTQHVGMSYEKASGLLRFYLNGVKVTEYYLGTFTPQTSFPLAVGFRPDQEHYSGSMDELGIYNRVLGDGEFAAIHQAGSKGKCHETSPPNCVPPTAGIVGWWPGNGTSNDVVGGNHAILSGGVNYGAGKVEQAFAFSTNNTGARIPANPALNVGAGPGFTIEGWINPSDLNHLRPIAEWNNGNIGVHFWTGVDTVETGDGVRNLYANLLDTSGTYHSIHSAKELIEVGVWQHVALSYDKASGKATIYLNGNQVAQSNVGSFTPLTTGDFYLGYRPSGPFSGIAWAGGQDEITLYNRALTADEIEAIASAESGGKCRATTPPNCTQPPAGLVSWWPGDGNTLDLVSGNHASLSEGVRFGSGKVGQAFAFSVNNTGARIQASPSLNVGAGSGFTIEGWINPANLEQLRPIAEWNSGNIGAHFWTGVDTVSTGDGERNLYANLVDTSGTYHSIHSAKGLLTAGVWQHVALSYDKANGRAAIYLNGNQVAQANLGSFTPLTTGDFYLGFRPSGPFSGIAWAGGQDEISLYNRALTAGEIETIFHTGSDGKCKPPGSPTDGIPPTILAISPLIQTVNAGSSASISVTASGTPPLRYQWQRNGLNLPGKTNATLAFAPVSTTNAGNYRCVVNNPFGTATSSNAVLNVIGTGGNLPPIIAQQPENRTTVIGGTATFSVIATGAPPLSFQWRFNNQNLAGRTSSSLILSNVQPAMAGGFSVVVANSFGAVTSQTATLTVVIQTNSGPTIVSQPTSLTVTSGAPAVFHVTAGGTGPLAYQWRKNGENLLNATSDSLLITNAQPSHAGGYSVVVGNTFGAITSSVATLTVLTEPSTNPSTATIVRLMNTTASAGEVVSIPIQLTARGNENALGFSVNFNTALFTFAGATLNSNAASNATLLINDEQADDGKVGLAIALPAGATFNVSTQQIMTLSFNVALVTSTTLAPIAFSDSPTLRQVSDAQARTLNSLFVSGTVNIAGADFEGDSAPRPNGNRALTITDWVQVGRYAAGLDSITNSSEFQRADCAPRSSRGNGAISVTDWVQAGRYAVGLDPLTLVGGPTGPVGTNNSAGGEAFQAAGTRTLSLGNATVAAGATTSVAVKLESTGSENALGFTITYDASKLAFVGATPGAGASGATLNVNASQSGRVGLALALPPGITLSEGLREVAQLQFAAIAGPANSALAFGDAPILCEVSDAQANSLATVFAAGSVAITPAGPPLTFVRSGNTLLISWSVSATEFQLESAADLNGAWTKVTGVVPFGDQNLAPVTIEGANKFFRLRKP